MSFIPDLSAEQVHAHLRSALDAHQRAEQGVIVWFAEMATRKLYRELDYSSMQQYAMEALGLSEARFHQFRVLSERLTALPELRRSVADGSIPWTNAREVARVATPETDKAWTAMARTTSRRELCRKIEAVRGGRRSVRRTSARAEQGSLGVVPESSPDDVLEVMAGVALSFTPEQLATFEALLEKAMQSGEVGKREDLVLALMTLGLDALVASSRGAKNQPIDVQRHTRVQADARSPYRIIVQACPECGRGNLNTARGALPLSLVELERLSCDAVIERDGKNHATVPPRLRRLALARAGYRCQAAGCGRALFLNVHHVVFREAGGPNTLENLIVLCSACHRTLHAIGERRARVEGASRAASSAAPAREAGPEFRRHLK